MTRARRLLARLTAALVLAWRPVPRTPLGPKPAVHWVTPMRRRTDRHPRTRVTLPPPCAECDGSGITTDPISPTDPTPCSACPAGEAWTAALVAVATNPEESP